MDSTQIAQAHTQAAEDAGANADSYSALSAALDDVPSHVVPPRRNEWAQPVNAAGVPVDWGDTTAVAVVPVETVETAIAEAGETLRPSVAAVHAEISRRATALAVNRDNEAQFAAYAKRANADNDRDAAALLDLMREAGVASTGVQIDDEVRTVTVVVKHDHRIDDLDAAILALNLDGAVVPMTEPVPAQVDQAAIKRIAKVRPDGLAGVTPTESAHLRWT